MFTKKILQNIQKSVTSKRNYAKFNNPISRTWNTITKDIKLRSSKETLTYPEHADVVIIGGGFIGSSAAYWLKSRAGDGLSVVVLEKDPTYADAQNVISHGVLTQHFSLPENIYLSQYSGEFLRNIKEHLKPDTDLQFCPHGYLLLASDKYAENLEHNVTLQQEYGIKNKLLTCDEIQNKYPWINTSGIKLGCMSTEAEGVFNAKALREGFILKSQELGAKYFKAEMVGFEMEQQRDVLMEGVAPGAFNKINKLRYRTDDDQEHTLKFAVCIVAAGSDTAKIASFAKIGESDGLLKVPLPIEKRTYNVYSLDDASKQNLVGLHAPFVMDTSGLWLRRNGLQNNLICGQLPALKEGNNVSENDIFQASLKSRFPKYDNCKINVLSSESFDCNTYDDTGVLGPHVYHTNLFFAAGFGRQGVCHSPGIGKAVAESIIDCQYTTIDLTRFGFDRILMDEPLVEFNVY